MNKRELTRDCRVCFTTTLIWQNPELAHVWMDVAKVDSWTSHVDIENDLC